MEGTTDYAPFSCTFPMEHCPSGSAYPLPIGMFVFILLLMMLPAGALILLSKQRRKRNQLKTQARQHHQNIVMAYMVMAYIVMAYLRARKY